MAIAYGAAGTQVDVATSASTASLAYPSGITANQCLVAVFACNGTAAITPPTGWTTLFDSAASQTSTDPRVYAAVKIATGSESGTVAFTSASNIRWSGQMHRFTGVNTTTPVDGTASVVDSGATSTTTAIIPSVTASTTGCVPIYGASQQSTSRTFTGPGTEITDLGPGNGGTAARCGGFYYEAPLASSGATGTRTVTASATGIQTLGAMALLRPAASAAAKTLTGSITAGGTLGPRTATKRPTGSIAASGTITRTFSAKTFAGSITAAGTKIARSPKAFAGSITGTGNLQRGYPRTITGTITGTGTIVRAPAKTLAGSSTGVGVVRRVTTKLLAGATTSTGTALKRLVNRALAGAITTTGTILRYAIRFRATQGTITATGTKTHVTQKRPSGSITATGAYRRVFSTRFLGGTIATFGDVLAGIYHRVFGRSGRVELTVTPTAEVTLSVYLRNRVAIEAYTVADVLLDGAYYTSATGAPSRTATPPGSPTVPVARAGNTQAVVSFAPPADDGGSPITGYTVTASTGQTATGPASPITVPGLVNGTAVVFIVTATNALGDSIPSDVTSPVTPAPGAPEAPGSITLTPGNGQVVVSWAAPANNGGSVITGYTVNVSTGAVLTSTTTSKTITGLTNGTPVTVTVTASNAVGDSAPSTRSDQATPGTVPGAPTVGTAIGGTAQITAQWTAPVSTGGVPLVDYLVTVYAGSSSTVVKTATVGPGATSLAVTGLANGSSYSFVVQARNSFGAGAASSRSNATTPALAGITTRTATKNQNASGSSTVVLSKPTGTTVGDVLVATFSTSDVLVQTIPAGWTQIGYAEDTGSVASLAYYHVITSADAGVTSWTWKLKASSLWSGGIQAYVNVNTTSVLDGIPVTQVAASSSSTSVTGTYTTSYASSMLVAGIGPNSGSASIALTPPTGWTEDYDLAGDGKNNSQAHRSQAAPGTGSYTWTVSDNRSMTLVLFALRSN